MNYTENYKLPTWTMTDRIQMQDFNDMTAKIDGGLTAVQNAVRAEETARKTALSSEQAARAKAIAAANARMDRLGNCRIHTCTYTGTGTYGEGNPTVIPMPKEPYMVLVYDSRFKAYFLTPNTPRLEFPATGGTVYAYLTWTDTSLSIQAAKGAGYQFNDSRIEYRVVAFYRADEA